MDTSSPDRSPADDDALTAAKAALRSRHRAARRALDPAERARQAEAAVGHLWPWLAPRLDAARAAGRTPVVTTVLPMGSEPDTGPLRARLLEAGARVLVPVIEPERRMSWAEWTPGTPLARAANAPVDEPTGPRLGPEALEDAALVLVPALAVDRAGMRMGQGGGYYDRFLAGLPGSVLVVAHVFAHELLAAGEVPFEPTDRPVDGVLTADGLTWLTAAERPAETVHLPDAQ